MGRRSLALVYALKSVAMNLIGKAIFSGKIKTQGIDGSRYRDEVIRNSDYQKFDGMLKMVFDGSKEQEQQIRSYLEEKFQKRELVYGIHTSPEALMTCLVFSYNGRHAHFVDGSHGGYALAAKQLKERLQLVRPKTVI